MVSVFLFLGALIVSGLLTGVVYRYALATSMLDLPNERSSHSRPTPRGGGLAIAATVLIVVQGLALGGVLPLSTATAFLGALPILVVGWLDDRRGVHPVARLAVHLGAAIWAVLWLGGLPEITVGPHTVALGHLGSVLAAIAVVWCINLYNFMDGIDGLAASQAVAVGVIGALLIGNKSPALFALALATAGASAGFLVWNWPPARIFMGDVGSSLLGFLFAVIGLASENSGALPSLIWLLLLGVFVADASTTLLRRMLRGEAWYAAHRTHAYQRLVGAGWSHGAVTGSALVITLVLGIVAHVIADDWSIITFSAALSLPVALCLITQKFTAKPASRHPTADITVT